MLDRALNLSDNAMLTGSFAPYFTMREIAEDFFFLQMKISIRCDNNMMLFDSISDVGFTCSFKTQSDQSGHMMLIWSQRIPLACSFKTNRINQVICAFYTMRYIFDSISVHLIWILFNLFSVWSQLFNVFGSHTLLYVIRSIVRIQFDCFGSISMIQCIQFPYSFKT